MSGPSPRIEFTPMGASIWRAFEWTHIRASYCFIPEITRLEMKIWILRPGIQLEVCTMIFHAIPSWSTGFTRKEFRSYPLRRLLEGYQDLLLGVMALIFDDIWSCPPLAGRKKNCTFPIQLRVNTFNILGHEWGPLWSPVGGGLCFVYSGVIVYNTAFFHVLLREFPRCRYKTGDSAHRWTVVLRKTYTLPSQKWMRGVTWNPENTGCWG